MEPAPPVLLPPREEQTARRLRLGDEQWALTRRLEEAPVETLAGQSRVSAPGSGATAGDPVPAAAVRARLAATIRADAAAMAGRGRLATADGPVGNYVRFAERLRPEEEHKRVARFFQEDPLEEQAGGSGEGEGSTDPATYAMFRTLFATLAAHRPAGGPLPTRAEASAAAGEDVPRPAALPILLRSYFTPFRMPPRPSDRLCARGQNCLFRKGSEEHGYVGREFYIHTPPAADAPRGPCIDCLLFGWKVRVQQNLKERTVPGAPVNTFRVLVGRNEYGSHCMLRTKVDSRFTGIEGHVPEYHLNMRAWVALPEDHAELFGLPPLRRGRAHHFLAEAHMDFHQASAEPTAALTC